MKPLIVVDHARIASTNIGKFLNKNLNILECNERIVDLNCIKDRKEDLFIIASPHSSKVEMSSLTAHTPGNFGNADLGGLPRTLSISPAFFVSEAVRKLNELNIERNLNYNVSLEVTHHGPSYDKPIVFVEVGGQEKNWNDLNAAKAVADTIMYLYNLALNSEYEGESYIGIGGTHYAPNFTKLVLQGYNIGHIMPKYAIENFDEDMFEQMIEKTYPKPIGLIIDWKGLNRENREKAIKLGKEFGIKILKCIGSKVKEVE